jgi:hypothetical protein
LSSESILINELEMLAQFNFKLSIASQATPFPYMYYPFTSVSPQSTESHVATWWRVAQQEHGID